MTLQLRIVLIILILLTFTLFVSQIKQKKLNLQYTLTWLALLFFVLLVTIIPGLLNVLSSLMGVVLPINMIFFIGFVFTLIIIYRLTIAISKQSEQIKELTQKVALMEKEKNDKQ
jgi:hypothetical protein